MDTVGSLLLWRKETKEYFESFHQIHHTNDGYTDISQWVQIYGFLTVALEAKPWLMSDPAMVGLQGAAKTHGEV